MSDLPEAHVEILRLRSTERFQLIDITGMVEDAVVKSGVSRGLVLVFAPHTTASIIINEGEGGLMSDIMEKAKDFTQPGSTKWRHNLIDRNAHAHIGSAIFGSERCLPVVGGRVARGPWQNIMFFEMDGPREERMVYVVVVGE